MTRIILILLLLFSVNAAACKEPITISYGPYVTLLTVNSFFSELHDDLSEATGCLVEYKLYKDFDTFIDSLIRQEHALSVVPGSYLGALKGLSYKHIASIKNTNETTRVLVRASSNIKSLNDLTGKHVMAISPFSESGARLLQALDDKKLLPFVRMEYGHNYESMVFSVISGKADAAVIIPEYWELLDKGIRTRSLNIIAKLPYLTAGFVMLPSDHKLDNILLKLLLKNQGLAWDKPVLPVSGLEVIDKLIKRRTAELLLSE